MTDAIQKAREAMVAAREALREDNMFTLSVKIDAALEALDAQAKGEADYQEYRKQLADEFADEPADLAQTLWMLEKWTPDALPADENGRIPFARALLESAEDAIRKHLAALDAEAEVKVTTLTRPIIGIENRTAQEVFDIMCDRIRSALVPQESRS